MDFLSNLSQGGVYSNMGTPTTALGFPEVLDYPNAEHLIDQLSESQPLLGVDGTGEPITFDLDTDSPNVLIQGGPGAGKSVTARSVFAQALSHGAEGVILDVKRISHKWAYDHSHIHYAKDLPAIGNALVHIGREVHRRNEVAEKYHGPVEDAPVGPRIIVLAEELNATMKSLIALSRRIPKGAYSAMDALWDILLMGRAAKVHVIGVMQFPDFRILDQAMIECFTVRCMSRYTKSAWTKIAWDAGLPQPAPAQTGRGMVVYGGKARETQFLLLTEHECRKLSENIDF